MISINEAAAQGIDRVRMDVWSNPEDHIKIDIIDGRPGPWGHLYSPGNECIGQENPKDFLLMPPLVDVDRKCFVPFVQSSNTKEKPQAHLPNMAIDQTWGSLGNPACFPVGYPDQPIEEGPGEEDGPWAEGWKERCGIPS